MNLLLLTSHSIAEYDDLRMLTDLGYDVFSIGAYTDPANPDDDKRPALPGAPDHPDLRAACERQREKHAGEDTSFVIDWAKGDLAPEIVDWADAIIVHHFPIPWIVAQWSKLRTTRVIWRTCGQSDPELERFMAPLHRQGLEIVRYSPRERIAFEKAGAFAGENALIRFGKYPSDWYGWTGDDPVVGNITQHGSVPHSRDEAVNWAFFEAATEGLPVTFAGPHSELVGGLGTLSYDEMREFLRRCRAYLYTGTRPASYTLGLIEAMMTGTPVVSISPEAFLPELPELFEGAEIAGGLWDRNRSDEINNPLAHVGNPAGAKEYLEYLLADDELARTASIVTRERTIELFGIDTIGPQWRAFLGGHVVEFSFARQTLTAVHG